MQPLNLRQIEVFRAVMITGSINGAAQLLLVSQPAVSRMLSHTEARIGFKLFERIKGRLYPSPEARSLFNDVESVYRDVQRVNSTLHNLVQQRQGVLRIASSPSLGHQLVPDAIGAFRQCNENILVSLECLRHMLLRDRLLDQHADVGISLFPIDHPNILAVPLSYIRVMVICPADHPVTKLDTKDLPQALAKMPFIGYSADTPFHSFMMKALERVGLPYRPSIDVDSPHHACALVKNGTGFSVVDEVSFRASGGERMAVLPIMTEERLTVSLVHLRQEPLAQFAQAFVEHLRCALSTSGFHLFNMD